MSVPSLLHVSPHPDDELIGAPATLIKAKEAGWTVINLACGLGRKHQHGRRRAELEQACQRIGFELLIADQLPPLEQGHDRLLTQHVLAAQIQEVIIRQGARVVISPSPHDGHHGHETVARAVAQALTSNGSVEQWLMWGLWADLPFPNVITPFSKGRLGMILEALELHAGEVARTDYLEVVTSRARLSALIGPERVFGFGSAGRGWEYAELLTRAVRWNGEWRLCSPSVFEPQQLSHPERTGEPISWWLEQLSLRDEQRVRRAAQSEAMS